MPMLYPTKNDKKRLQVVYELTSKIKCKEGERISSFIDFIQWGNEIDSLDIDSIFEGLNNIQERGKDLDIIYTAFGLMSSLDCVIESYGITTTITLD